MTLPAGSRCLLAWVSDEPVDDGLELASRLAAGFEQSGLWPLLWYWEQAPDSDIGGGDTAGGRRAARTILRGLWDS